MAKGIRKIDEIAGQDGTVHPIRCDLATGKFSIVFAGASGMTVHRIDGKDLELVREERSYRAEVAAERRMGA